MSVKGEVAPPWIVNDQSFKNLFVSILEEVLIDDFEVSFCSAESTTFAESKNKKAKITFGVFPIKRIFSEVKQLFNLI